MTPYPSAQSHLDLPTLNIEYNLKRKKEREKEERKELTNHLLFWSLHPYYNEVWERDPAYPTSLAWENTIRLEGEGHRGRIYNLGVHHLSHMVTQGEDIVPPHLDNSIPLCPPPPKLRLPGWYNDLDLPQVTSTISDHTLASTPPRQPLMTPCWLTP
ncbi:hypothetical protein Bbelb_151310 [Branchiostoma belcheri]|nr:hypothetical protein Bbelb_151310 [Branchiostoma belcheri]